MTTPYAVLDVEAFLLGFLSEVLHYSKGHPGMEGETLRYYARLLFVAEAPAGGLAVAGLAYGLIKQPRVTLVAGIFPLLYFTMIADLPVRNVRTFLPVVPFLCIFAARFVWDLSRFSERYRSGMGRVVLLLASAVLVAVPAFHSAQSATVLTNSDVRAEARQWIAANLPADSSILLESYSPYVDSVRFNVSGVRMMIDEDAAERLTDEPDYLIFSSGMYARYVNQSERYPLEASQYAELFERFELLRSFTNGPETILIYQPD